MSALNRAAMVACHKEWRRAFTSVPRPSPFLLLSKPTRVEKRIALLVMFRLPSSLPMAAAAMGCWRI